jgi:hypothetical protein
MISMSGDPIICFLRNMNGAGKCEDESLRVGFAVAIHWRPEQDERTFRRWAPSPTNNVRQ